jgi:hypothetical protein
MQSKAIEGATRATAAVGAACLFMTLAGCAADGASQAQGGWGGRGGRPDLVPSPARDLVRPGHAELVLTNDRWPTFEEARANPSTSVTGDSPLYAHIRAARSLGELALPADPRGRYSFSAYPHLYLQVGDTESLRSASTCYVTLSPGQLESRELVVQLAPPAPLPDGALSDCWVAATASPRSRAQVHEIRLAGFVGLHDGWLPQSNLLAVATAPAFDNGGSQSTARPRVEPVRQAVPSFAPAPPALAPVPVAADADADVGAGVEAGADASVPASALAPAVAPVASPVPVPVPVAAPAPAPAPAPTFVPAPSPVPAPAVARPAVGSDTATRPAPVRLVIRHSEGDAAAESRARAVQGRLEAHRKFDVELQPVAESVSADNLRIFFESDRLEARITRDLIDGGPIPIRDFSDLRPRPRSGTIELWLAATPSSGVPAPDATAIEIQRPSAAPAESTTTPPRRSEPASAPPAPARTVSETLRLLLLRPGN